MCVRERESLRYLRRISCGYVCVCAYMCVPPHTHIHTPGILEVAVTVSEAPEMVSAVSCVCVCVCACVCVCVRACVCVGAGVEGHHLGKASLCVSGLSIYI